MRRERSTPRRLTSERCSHGHLFACLDALPWHDVPISHSQTDRGHGRITRRTMRVLPAPADLPFPHVHQGIESLHWLRDTVYREDDSRVRTRSGPRVMAALRNLAIGGTTPGRTRRHHRSHSVGQSPRGPAVHHPRTHDMILKQPCRRPTERATRELPWPRRWCHRQPHRN
jgi:hypothetical protein